MDCVIGMWAGEDSVWEQYKLEATLCETLKNAAECLAFVAHRLTRIFKANYSSTCLARYSCAAL